jgi:ribose 5-phosphate isomerase B
MKIYLAADHSGLAVKNKVKDFLQSENYSVEDCGATTYDKNDDYPDFISKAAALVAKDQTSKGIVFGGSGQGEAMVANKCKGIRCALFYAPALPTQAVNIEGEQSTDPFEIVRLTRMHNQANMLSVGVRFAKEEDILQAITIWLETPDPTAQRHLRRVKKIEELEEHV